MAKYGASKSCRWDLRPNNLVFWEAIKWACENGYTYFDMGRSGIEGKGLQRSKNGWGGESEPLYYTSIPATSVGICQKHTPKLIRSFIQKAPNSVCRLGGELLYRYFG